ncbi:hypothetical protein AB4455_10540 [Vibrio sp. 10N.261.46.E12]|uniref:DUF6035 family protein n=1 Tax=unclassified Vibrio TaxID=2614977 RepID=UPI0009758ECC|nr:MULTISPECIES: hypothetical protein [unclassified Vibrio]OMO36093.1 hypothetical protein BH584_04785 [Vibrio sp. 10N.261.45.E1]PMJ34555.1 hypothetical protein BCU27_03750 [Vibrio sp. 10N.286.45.B6]PMM67411.1 hypothetical protein BCT48_15295 [Vibrio sp. 10N.261.46.F12]PMM81706.1 hypothetical protein BCT46_14965 [Vibrio sp. 10N.261.46.E8]PMN91934.1 hypothetical protein BCT25_00915 [Vibrio sp. 10N.261.45.A6]
MERINKNSFWELYVKGFKGPILASDYLAMFVEVPDRLVTAKIKRNINEHVSRGEDYMKCAYCGCVVRYRDNGDSKRDAFYHKHDPGASYEQCPFHSGYTGDFPINDETYEESQWHFRTKHAVARILTGSPSVNAESVLVERFVFGNAVGDFGRRRPDVQFTDIDGNKFAVELIRGWMNSQLIYDREQFFRAKGINLLWLLSDNYSPAILNYVMFGSNLEDDANYSLTDLKFFEPLPNGAQFNAFIFGADAENASVQSGELNLTVHHPVFSLDPISAAVKVDYGQKQIDLPKLSLDPGSRLPFAINTQFLVDQVIRERHQLIEYRKISQTQEAVSAIEDILRNCNSKNIGTYTNSRLHGFIQLLNDHIDYVQECYSGRERLQGSIEEVKVRIRNLMVHRERSAQRNQLARELKGFLYQLRYGKRKLAEGISLYDLQELKANLEDTFRTYESTVKHPLASSKWNGAIISLKTRLNAQTQTFQEGLPQPRAVWSIRNTLLSLPLDKQLEILDPKSKLGIELTNQQAAYLLHKTSEESAELSKLMLETKLQIRKTYINRYWAPLVSPWNSESKYQSSLNNALALVQDSGLSGIELVKKEWVMEVLKGFVQSLDAPIKKRYKQRLSRTQMTTKEADEIKRLVALYKWLYSNDLIASKSETTWMVKEVICWLSPTSSTSFKSSETSN